MTGMSFALRVLSIIVPVFLIGYILESFRNVSSIFGDYLEITTELLPLVMSFSIFAMTWFAYNKNKDNHSLFMGMTFLVIGLFGLYHLLSLPFMPAFITSNSPQKVAIFWSGAMLISALLFLASVYIYKDTLPGLINKPVLFVSAVVLSVIFLTTVLFYPDNLPAMYYPDGSPSAIMISSILIAGVIILYASYLYTGRLRETGQKNLICLIYGFIIIVFSNSAYFFSNYSEHLLRAAGFYFLYFSIFKSSIEQPYEKQVATNKKALKESEERYRRLVEYSPDGTIVHNLHELVFVNTTAAKILGASNPQELIGKPLMDIIHPDYREIVNERLRMEKEGKAVPLIEEKFMRLDGTPVDVEVMAIPYAHMGKLEVHSVVRDITERKKADEQIKASLREKEVLLREIHHRVKNNMQIISSLLRLQSEYIDEKRYIDMFKESQNRIMSMSLIHEKLYISRDLAKIDLNEYIRDIVNGLFQSYESNAGNITSSINVNDISLGIDSAIPCGLIINELVTNSIKYAFPDGRKGEIKITFRSLNVNEIELIVSDNGVGIAENLDFRKTKSFGLHLVIILVENQLQGEISLNQSAGTEFHIKFRAVRS